MAYSPCLIKKSLAEASANSPDKRSSHPKSERLDSMKRHETLVILIATKQRAASNVKMQAVQREQAFLHSRFDERKGAEIGKRETDRSELECHLFAMGRHVGLQDVQIVEQREPPPNKTLLRRVAPNLLPIGRDAATMRMAEHDDVWHLEGKRGKFDGGAGPVIFALRLVGRDKVGHVAKDEQVAGLSVENRRHVDPSIAAGNDMAAGAWPNSAS
jgi:hypothetical protein